MKDKLGQLPAFPVKETPEVGERFLNGDEKQGMSRRFYAACAAMQGLIANDKLKNKKYLPDSLIRDAYIYADELLRQENL